jgi:Histidine kinase-, DNA gyrase B-, and HSP90-like ATPase
VLNQSAEVLVGSDVLEIMSIAMYAEPLALYRELIQNSADAIERAIREGVLLADAGRVAIEFNILTRSVCVRDNGCGLANEEFRHQMLSLGASAKRSGSYRGFRGIGRLAGLGQCRSLVFRSRAKGDQYVYEASWDAPKVRRAILGPDVIALADVMKEAVAISRAPAEGEAEHFFEVRMEGMRRLPDDRLFDPTKISRYLSQVAPVKFSPTFAYADFIRNELFRRTTLLEISLTVAGRDVFKPYADSVEIRKKRFSAIRDVQFIEVPSSDDQIAAFGWIAHTDYLGALHQSYAGRGLRVRSGNLQIGDANLLTRAFPEERFNDWSIGEFHVFDARLRPNARRDAFEPSIAVDDLFNQLAPHGNAIARRCRAESKKRQVARRLELANDSLGDLDKHLLRNRSSLAAAVRKYAYEQLSSELAELYAVSEALKDDRVTVSIGRLRKRVVQRLSSNQKAALRPSQRELGHLDAIRCLYASGQKGLVGRLVAALTRAGGAKNLKGL